MYKNSSPFLFKIIAGGLAAAQIYYPMTVFASTPTPNPYPIIAKTEHGQTTFHDITTYSIDERTYIKLRDIAQVFCFKIEWDHQNKAVLLSLDEDYENPSRKEAVTNNTQSTPVTQKIIVDDNPKILSGYRIDGYTYFSIRDIAKLTNLEVIWNQDNHTIYINEKAPQKETDKQENVDVIVYENGKDILINDNRLIYTAESKQYDSIETFIQENIDPQFCISDFVVTEYPSSTNPAMRYLDIYNYIGDYITNFGYRLTIVQNHVKAIKCTGSRNEAENLDIDKSKIPSISDEELWQKTLVENPYTNCTVKQYTITRYYDEKTGAFQADVFVSFIDPNGYQGADRHTFVL